MIHPRLSGALLVLLGTCVVASAQQAPAPIPEVTSAYAITNATVVVSPGDTLEAATVVMRDGLILSVGQNAEIPFDAEVIKADSMFVYSAFVDGLSHTGIPTPKSEDQEDREGIKPGNLPPDVAGIQPQRDARDFFDGSDKSVGQLREAGYAVAHVAPRGQMLPGQGAAILLTDGDKTPAVLAGKISQFAQWQGARGVYPQTRMAIIATWRDLIPNARRHAVEQKLFAADASGMARPDYDPVLDALEPAASGKQPVFFAAESSLEVYRAVQLAEDLNLNLVLADVKEGAAAVLDGNAGKAAVLLSLELPKAIKEDKPDSTEAASAPVEGTERVADFSDVGSERKRLEARRKEVRQAHVGAAAALEQAGKGFGFSAMDVKAADIKGNLQEMIDAGLSETTALAALTTVPAELLGISGAVGTVEAGKIGNLLVTSGPLFEEKSAIRYQFVDGKKFTYDDKPKKKNGGDGSAENIAGTWAYELEGPMGNSTGTIVIRGSDGNFEGTFKNDDLASEADLQNVTVDGDQISFSTTIDAQGQTITIQFDLTVDGEEMEGSIDLGPMGSFPIEATRTGDPDKF